MYHKCSSSHTVAEKNAWSILIKELLFPRDWQQHHYHKTIKATACLGLPTDIMYSASSLRTIFPTDSREGCYREPNSSVEETDDGQEGSRASSQGAWGTDAEGGWAETPSGHSPMEEATSSKEGGAWQQEVSCNKGQMDRQINCRVHMLILNRSLSNQCDDRPMASIFILLTVAASN